MVWRQYHEPYGLLNRIGDPFPFGPRYGFGIQRIEDNDSLAGRDDPAVQIAGAEQVMAGNDFTDAAGLAALRLRVRRSANTGARQPALWLILARPFPPDLMA